MAVSGKARGRILVVLERRQNWLLLVAFCSLQMSARARYYGINEGGEMQLQTHFLKDEAFSSHGVMVLEMTFPLSVKIYSLAFFLSQPRAWHAVLLEAILMLIRLFVKIYDKRESSECTQPEDSKNWERTPNLIILTCRLVFSQS